MKKILILLVAGIIGVAGASFWWVSVSRPPGGDSSLQRFVIARGETANQVGVKLKEQGIIRDSLSFRVYAQLTGAAKNIPSGEYSLPANLTLTQVVALLLKGPSEIWVTVPEGLRREEIADKFIKNFGLMADDAQSFQTKFLDFTSGHEGYLFPDTYLFPKDATASAVVNRMLSVFDLKVDSTIKDKIKTKGLSLNDGIILASILERETVTNEERPIVAGILIKRLNAGWELNADATVQYALATSRCGTQIDCNWWVPVLQDDLKINSPFNTYKFPGLPSSPIASPGISSIMGVANAVLDTPYWYYLHDSKGVIHYATTLDEHNDNVRKYLQ